MSIKFDEIYLEVKIVKALDFKSTSHEFTCHELDFIST